MANARFQRIPAVFIKKFRRCFVILKDQLMVNEEIRDKEVRLIDVDGKMLGIMSAKEAQKLANARNLDLVKIAPKANPPVCRIMDYGKYIFELSKKEKEAKKNQKVINVKEVRLSPNIEENDLNFKVRNTIRFLKDGNKVKVVVRFRGREIHHTSIGQELLERFAEAVKDYGTVEKKPKLEGKSMTLVLNPKS
ncbi:MAG TPA: translation initiation factor IF-3 [Clostridiaceae bacterium]|nr:translation initiation factor IF-3 [Clostridiaceae bacterium]